MKKVFFDQGSRPITSSHSTSRSSRRDASQVSSRWKEVSEQRSPRERRVERKQSGSQHPKKRTHLAKDNPEAEFHDEEVNASPFDVYGNLEQRRKQQGASFSKMEVEGDEVTGAFAEEKKSPYSEINLSAHKHKKNDKIIAMREDTSFMSPTAKSQSIASVQTGTDGVKSKISPKAVSLIEELVNKIVDEVNILKVDGRTETTLTLKHPPMFSGAQVTITEFDTAKKEFNIKFENLSQEAHELISKQSNLDRLQSGLQQKGYNVHIVTANTEIEQPEHIFEGYNDRDGSDKRDEQQQHSEQDQEEQE